MVAACATAQEYPLRWCNITSSTQNVVLIDVVQKIDLKFGKAAPAILLRRAGTLILLWILSSNSVHAVDEDKEQAFTADIEINAEAPTKKAENIDLKEVIKEPLEPAEALPAAPIKEAPVTAEPYSIDAKIIVEETLEKAAPETAPATSNIATPTPGLLQKLAQELVGEPAVEDKPPLVLLNSEVLPGVSTRLGWSPSVSFTGISAPTAVLVVNGVRPGPTLCLTAAVHGDELNGIEIVRRVLYNVDPQQLTGALIGVPIVNMQGFRRSSRYLPDRRDLNRFFPGNPEGSSAARIAHSFFSEVITHCDRLIDLHTGSFRRTNLPQLRADLGNEEVANLARKMGAIVVVQSKGAEGSLRRAAVESGIPAVTLEAGAPHELQKTSIEHGVKSIESAMDNLGMVHRRRFWERPAEPVYYQSTWVRAKEGGMLFSEVDLGASVKKGDLLGTVTDPITNMRTNIIAPFDGRVIGMALNQVMFPGFAAYHLGLKASVEEAAQSKPVLVEASVDTEENPPAVAEGIEPAPEPLSETTLESESPLAEEESVAEVLSIEDSE